MWVSECEVDDGEPTYRQETIEFHGSDVRPGTGMLYSWAKTFPDSSCSPRTGLSLLDVQARFRVNVERSEFKVTSTSELLSFSTEAGIQEARERQFCGHADWKINQPFNVMSTDCGSDGQSRVITLRSDGSELTMEVCTGPAASCTARKFRKVEEP